MSDCTCTRYWDDSRKMTAGAISLDCPSHGYGTKDYGERVEAVSRRAVEAQSSARQARERWRQERDSAMLSGEDL